MLLIWSVVLISLLCGLLQGSSGVKSIVGFKKCDQGYWGIYALFIIYISLMAVLGSWVVISEQKAKKAAGWEFSEHEVQWSLKKILLAHLISLLIGFSSAIAGIGGGTLLNPVLTSWGYLPRATSSSVMLLIFTSKLVTAFLFILSGQLLYDYVLFIGAFVILAVLLAMFSLSNYVKNSGR